MTFTSDSERCQYAAELARRYGWPEQADEIEGGRVPSDFSREVGRNIAMFKRTFPFGTFSPQQHIVDDLGDLRKLIARIEPHTLADHLLNELADELMLRGPFDAI